MGRYTLLRRLAVGGMAELYVAHQVGIEGFEKIVALKRVLPHLGQDPQFVRMFLAEARIAAALDHPNIAHVTDIGESDGEYFFAMEYVHGANLLEVLRHGSNAPLPLGCALTIVGGVAAALHHAHEHLGADGRPLGLVHRDVSPSNVMIAHSGAVKLTDFGIVRAAARTSTTQGHTKGKAGYMSPEQCRGDRIDRRSDIFALGIVLYEATTGVRAFYAPNDYAILGRIAKADYIPPHEVVPDYPPALAQIIARALSKDPDHRHPTAEALQLELEDFAHVHGVRLSGVDLARHMKAAFGSPAHPHTDLGSLSALPPEPSRPIVTAPAAPSRLPWMLAGFASATALAVAVWPRSGPAIPREDVAGAEVRGQASDASRPTAVAREPQVVHESPEPASTVPPAAVEPSVDIPEADSPDHRGETGSSTATTETATNDESRPSPRTRRPSRRRKPARTPDEDYDRNSLYPPGMKR